jgi:DNA-binding transcriptional LysR family regulator
VFRKEYSGKSFTDVQLSRLKLKPNEALRVSDFLLLPFIVAESHYVALVHRRLAEKMKKVSRIKLLPPPFPTDKLHVELYWSRHTDTDPAHQWFRGLLREASATVR